MMQALAMEFYKTRRRRVWLIIAALIGVQIVWALWSLSRRDASDLKQGWMWCLYQFPLLNSIMMPVVAAVVASRLSDVEHKGQTFKLLETVMPAGRLFTAKFLCGAVYLLAAVALQIVVMVVAGHMKGFAGRAPVLMFAYYFIFTAGVSLTILLLQQILSLLFVNQMVPLSAGLIGGLSGLFLLFFPQNLEKFILWGYYGVLIFVGMDWDPATRVTNLYWVPVDWPGFLALTVMFCVLYAAGRTLFVRKEM